MYYFPGHPKPVAKPKDLPPECGLQDVLRDANFAFWDVLNFLLDGTRGPAICIQPPKGGNGKSPRMGCCSDTQKWVKVCGPDGKVTHWFGWEKNNPPGPADLARPRAVDGHPVRLGDGKEWIIPSVHIPLTTLPRDFTFDESGELTLTVASGYEELCNESAKWWNVIENGEPFNKFEWFDFVCGLLAVNYRLGKTEIAHLRLLNDSQEVLRGVLYAALGVPALKEEIEAQKKTNIQPDGCEAEPGDAA